MKHPFYWLHGVLAIIGIGVCGVLLTADKGHPPAIVFLPLAVIAWVLLHLFLGLVQLLAVKGRARSSQSDARPGTWPVVLLIIVAVASFAFLYMLAGSIEWFLSNHAWTTRRMVYFALPFVALACLSGILLRMDWARLLAATVCFLMAGFLLLRVIPLVFSARELGVGMLLYAASLIGGLGALGYHLLTSQRIKSFFVHR